MWVGSVCRQFSCMFFWWFLRVFFSRRAKMLHCGAWVNSTGEEKSTHYMREIRANMCNCQFSSFVFHCSLSCRRMCGSLPRGGGGWGPLTNDENENMQMKKNSQSTSFVCVCWKCKDSKENIEILCFVILACFPPLLSRRFQALCWSFILFFLVCLTLLCCSSMSKNLMKTFLFRLSIKLFSLIKMLNIFQVSSALCSDPFFSSVRISHVCFRIFEHSNKCNFLLDFLDLFDYNIEIEFLHQISILVILCDWKTSKVNQQ